VPLFRSPKPAALANVPAIGPVLALVLVPLSTLLLALSLVLSAPPAFAADETETQKEADDGVRPFVEYMLGVSIVPNQTLEGSGATGAGLWGRSKHADAGYFVGGAVGARFLKHFRSELQIGFRSTEVENIAIQGERSDSNGDLSLFTVMANGYIDWDLGIGVVPFIGVGIGWGMPRLDVENQPGTTQLNVDDTDSVFVWNAMIGGTLPLSEIAELSLGYRYIQTEDIKLSSRIVDTTADPATSTGQRLDYEYDAHEIYLGLRFSF